MNGKILLQAYQNPVHYSKMPQRVEMASSNVTLAPAYFTIKDEKVIAQFWDDYFDSVKKDLEMQRPDRAFKPEKVYFVQGIFYFF